MQKFLFFSFVFFISYTLSSQVNYPRDYFGPPLNLPIRLAGNFGEIRPNHLHAGFDIRTNNKEGLPVYAAADGYVSRIRISPVGYGKAIYITHPNGYVSVYGHLKAFNTAIQAKASSYQYILQSFELDTLINRELLPVKKGELIGFSGNTGSSQAPHLHFEIRDEITEMPINPYLFGYQVKDHVKPVITGLVVYALDEQARINGLHIKKKLVPKKSGENYVLASSDSLALHGKIGFGINCYDKESEGSGTNNVFSIEMQYGGKRMYYFEMNSFSFDHARYVNAHIDYELKQRNHQTVQKCFLSKNNLLEIYKDVQNSGMIDFNDTASHWITFIIKDYAGNASRLVIKTTHSGVDREPHDLGQQPLDCLKNNRLSIPGASVMIPERALYDDINRIPFSRENKLSRAWSATYRLLDETVALQKPIVLSIEAGNVPEKWRNKACMVSIDKGKFNYEGGQFINDSMIAECYHFGKFTVALDTIPPKINAFTTFEKTDSVINLRKAVTLKFKVSDDLSGIKKYRATIDGNWVLCEYDAKNELLMYTFDSTVKSGLHRFKLEVTDAKENKRTWENTFVR